MDSKDVSSQKDNAIHSSRRSIRQCLSMSDANSPGQTKTTQACKVCFWTGQKLLTHLKKSASNCKESYDMEALENESKSVQREKDATRNRMKYHSDARESSRKKNASKQYYQQHDSKKKAASMTYYNDNTKKRKESMATYNQIHRETINDSMRHKYHDDSWSLTHRARCPSCNVVFGTQKGMNQHIEHFHSDEPQLYTCQICDKTLNNNGNLERHMREVHGGEKIYTCDGDVDGDRCIAAYSREENLAVHKKVGRHIFEFHCDYCYQSIPIKSPQNTINNRHIIKIPQLPHLTTCRNVKYGLGKKITEEDKERFRAKKYERTIRNEAMYEALRKYALEDDRFEPYVQKLIKEKKDYHEKCIERGRKIRLEEKMMKDAWDAYDWDSSMLDPTSQMPLSDPVRNKICGHLYEKSYIEKLIKQGPSDSKFKHVICPYTVNIGKEKDDWFGCTISPISLSDLEPDIAMKEEIDKRKEERKTQVENNPDLKGLIFRRADRKRLIQISKREFNSYLHFGFVTNNNEQLRTHAASLRRLGSGRFLKM